MVYILCDDYQQAVEASNDLMRWIKIVEPMLCAELLESANMVRDYESDIDYVFVDSVYFAAGLIDYDVRNDDVMDIYEFFIEDMLLQAQDFDNSFYFTSIPVTFV